MSLTSVPPGQPTPDDSEGGARTDDHGGMGPPSAEATRLGYEPDGYDTTSVVSVPILVIVFFVLAFGTTSILFAYFTRSQDYTGAHPQAAERNKAPLAERIGRINRGDGEVDHPRLEPLRVRSGDSRAITRPEEKHNNPPYLHPEDNRAEPARTPELFGEARHTPLDKLINKADGEFKNLFPVRKDESGPTKSYHLPTNANAGRGAEHSEAVPPPLHGTPEVKKEAPKKDEKKELPKGPTPPEGKK